MQLSMELSRAFVAAVLCLLFTASLAAGKTLVGLRCLVSIRGNIP